MNGTMTQMEREFDFDGKTFDKAKDGKRLNKQFRIVFDLMKDGAWRTLAHISEHTGCPESSISARIRDFRKAKFGGHKVNTRRKYTGSVWGVYEYQLIERGF